MEVFNVQFSQLARQTTVVGATVGLSDKVLVTPGPLAVALSAQQRRKLYSNALEALPQLAPKYMRSLAITVTGTGGNEAAVVLRMQRVLLQGGS